MPLKFWSQVFIKKMLTSLRGSKHVNDWEVVIKEKVSLNQTKHDRTKVFPLRGIDDQVIFFFMNAVLGYNHIPMYVNLE